MVRAPAILGALPAEAEPRQVLEWLRRHPALRRPLRPQGERLATGWPQLDHLLGGGVPRGGITEVVGPGSSGRTAMSLGIMAEATRGGHVVAWVDPADALDPLSVQAAGVVLERFLWIRPSGRNPLKQALKAADLVLDAGGFVALVLDLTDSRAVAMLERPAWWVRLTRRLEASHTALVTLGSREVAGTAATLRLECRRSGGRLSGGRLSGGRLSGGRLSGGEPRARAGEADFPRARERGPRRRGLPPGELGSGSGLLSVEVRVLRHRGGAPGGRTWLRLGQPVD